jgi:hypothetical protein
VCRLLVVDPRSAGDCIMSRKRRTEQLSVAFKDGLALGWAFGLSEAFKTSLDIRYETRVDVEASRAKERLLQRKLTDREKVSRPVWTQGVPAAYSFDRGHLFFDPPVAHLLPWDAALPLLRRSIVVTEARADAGALVEVLTDDDAEDTSVVIESNGTGPKKGSTGWVDVEVLYYRDGEVLKKEKTTRTQAALVDMLRTGKDPLEPSFEACYCRPSASTYSCLVCSPRRSLHHPETLSLFDGLDEVPSMP